MCAAEGGHLEVVRWLVDQGAALDERSKDGQTALYVASEEGRTPVVRLLLERGADPTVADRFHLTPLSRASSTPGHLDTVWCLLDHPSAAATINQRDKWGLTPLWRACYTGQGGVVRALLERGADFTITDDGGRTPMAVAQEGNNPSCVEALQVSSPSSLTSG
jgi:uncharacterized protein